MTEAPASNRLSPEAAAEAVIAVAVAPDGRATTKTGAGPRPVTVIGIAGPVSVGKSTFAEHLRSAVAKQGLDVDLVCTDCFLLPNDELARRNLTMRKGFPGTYDLDGLVAAINAIKRGGAASLPVYSHATYDTVIGERRRVGPVDVLIVEGINALQAPLVDSIDVSVYLDADEADLVLWFSDRFARLCETAQPGDFYAQFEALTPDQRMAIADSAWTSINAVNNRDHIAPTKANAQLVIQKNRDHSSRFVI